jgi:glycerate-2-kinase
LAFLDLQKKDPEGGRGSYLLSGATDAAQRAGLDPADSLARNDSCHFFQQIGGLLKTGPIFTNVYELQIVPTL